MRNSVRYFTYIVLITLILLIPRFITSTYYLSILIFVGLHSIIAMGLTLLMGYAGQISLGHASFYGLGAYISGILSVTYKFPPVVSLVVSMIITGVIACCIGIPILKLKGNFLAMGTLGLGIIINMIFVNWVSMTGGPSGLTSIPYLKIAGYTFDRDYRVYLIVWITTIVIFMLSTNIVNSRVGRALRSIHGSEIAANSMGVNPARYKVQIFVISAVYAALAGGLYAYYLTFISPQPFDFKFSIELVVMVVIGGMTSLWGATIGALTVTILTEILRAVIPKFLSHASGEYEIIFFGIILIIVMIFTPEGLIGGFRRIANRIKR